MEAAEFLVISYASSLTLSIIGVVKVSCFDSCNNGLFTSNIILIIFQEVTVLILAIVRNGNEVSTINAIGMVVCLTGITAHVIRKASGSDNSSAKKSAYAKVSVHSDDDEGNSGDGGLASSGSEGDFGGLRSSRGRSRVSYVDASSVINVKESLPLLSDNSDSEEEEVNVKSGRKKSRSVSSDDFIFREQRAWTSVKDRHLEMPGLETEDDEDILAEAEEIVNQHNQRLKVLDEEQQRRQAENKKRKENDKSANLLSD